MLEGATIRAYSGKELFIVSFDQLNDLLDAATEAKKADFRLEDAYENCRKIEITIDEKGDLIKC